MQSSRPATLKITGKVVSADPDGSDFADAATAADVTRSM